MVERGFVDFMVLNYVAGLELIASNRDNAGNLMSRFAEKILVHTLRKY